MRTTTRLATATAAGVVALAALTACAAGDQSRTDACIIVAQGLESVQEDIAGANAALATGDLLTVQANLESAAGALGELKPTVTNGEVAPILTALEAGLENVRTAVAEAGTTDTDAANAALDASAGDLQTAALRFNETCG